MNCPNCQTTKSETIDSRDSGQWTRRRRRCCKCGVRWSTYEIHAEKVDELMKPSEDKKLRALIEPFLAEMDEALNPKKRKKRFKRK